MISQEARDWDWKGKRKVQSDISAIKIIVSNLIIITNQYRLVQQDKQIIILWEVTDFILTCIISLILLAFFSRDDKSKNICTIVLSLHFLGRSISGKSRLSAVAIS